MDPELNHDTPINDRLAQIEASLRAQSEASHQGDVKRAAQQAEDSLAQLHALREAAAGVIVADRTAAAKPAAATPLAKGRSALQQALARARSLALYNQLLLRYSFTAWTAQRLERRRRAMAYDERGRPTQSSQGALLVSHQGVL